MASAFDVARRLASAGMGQVERAYEPLDQPGPDFAVSPFQPGTVSTAAGVVKALTAIGASRRLQANADQIRRDKALGAQKDMAELARIEAQTGYYNRRGTEAAKSTRMAVDPKQPWAKHLNTLGPDGTAEIADIRLAQGTWRTLLAKEGRDKAGRGVAQFKASTAAIAGKEKALERSLQAQADLQASKMYDRLMVDKNMLVNGTADQKKIAAQHLGIYLDSPDLLGDAEDRIKHKVEEARTFHYNALRRQSQRLFDKLDSQRDGLINPSWGAGGDDGSDDVIGKINAVMGSDDDEE